MKGLPHGQAWPWLTRATIGHHRPGDRLLCAGGPLDEWVALASAAVRVDAAVSPSRRLAVAALWSGDVIGRCSPLGSSVSLHDGPALSRTAA